MPAPNDIYYSRIDKRLPKHGEPLDRLQRNGILIDGEGVVEGGYTKVLLQRFGKTAIGPIFFEYIQRKGDDGFGEGRSEEHTSELQSRQYLVCRLLLEKKKKITMYFLLLYC